jgi:hypothetical protein
MNLKISQHKQLLSLLLSTTAFLLTIFILNNSAFAMETLSNEFPDPDIVSNGLPMAVAAYTTYTQSQTSTYRVWSKKDITFEVTVKNGNYCPAANKHDSKQPGDNGTIDKTTLTRFEIIGSGPPIEKIADYDKNCGNDISFTKRGVSVEPAKDPGNGYKYYVDFNVTQPYSGPKTGIINYYKLIASGGGEVKISVVDTKNDGLGATIQQVDDKIFLTNFRIKFGMCNGDKLDNKKMKFYDLDNDIYGSGAQRLKYITWQIQKNGNPFITNPPATDIPKTENQSWESPPFTIESDKQYKFIARDVYMNNVFQFSVPVDQIGYENCDKPDPCPPPNQNLYPPNCPEKPEPNDTSFNWAVDSTSSVSANSPIASGPNYVVVNQNSTFTFTHDRNKAWSGSDDKATTWIDIDIISNKPSIDFPDQWRALDLYDGQDININPKDWSYSTDKAGEYCQQIKYPTTYTGGMTGRAKVINKTIAANGTHTNDTGLESNGHYLDKNGTPRNTADDYYYDKVRRYAHYPTDGGWRQESTVKNPVPGAPEQIWWWVNGIQQTSTTDISNYYWASGPYGKEYSTNQVCAYVVETDPVAPSDSEYEKGDSKIVAFGARANSGDAELPQNVTFTASYNIGAPLNKTGTVPVTIGPGVKDKSESTNITLTDAEKAILNDLDPGTKVPFTISMNGSTPQYGDITITEVPFARFYGNDVYSTNGQLKFNDSNNVAFDAKGSVAQYAAFAAGDTNYLDTAGYRKDLLSPNPPTGLSSNNYPFHSSINAEKVYNDAESNLPINCANYAGGTLPATGCFNATSNPTTINGSGYSTKTTIKGSDVVINGDITNSSFDPSPATVATVYQHIEYNNSSARPWEASGYKINLPEGNYSLSDLRAKGIGQGLSPTVTDISSIALTSPNHRIIAYDDSGNSIVFNGNDDNFLNNPRGAGNWNDMVASIDIQRIPSANFNVDATGVLLIVADNIYINKGVQRVDAILVAKNNIYTCADPDNRSDIYSNNELDENCRTTLTINGSLSAPNIAFQRVGGSRYLNTGTGNSLNDLDNCNLNRGIKNCVARGGIDNPSGKTAEIINFPAYLYWAQPYLVNKAGSGGTYDSLNLAPPRQ